MAQLLLPQLSGGPQRTQGGAAPNLLQCQIMYPRKATVRRLCVLLAA